VHNQVVAVADRTVVHSRAVAVADRTVVHNQVVAVAEHIPAQAHLVGRTAGHTRIPAAPGRIVGHRHRNLVSCRGSLHSNPG